MRHSSVNLDGVCGIEGNDKGKEWVVPQIRVLVVAASVVEPPRTVTLDPTHPTFCALVDDYNTDTVFFEDASGAMKVASSAKASADHLPNPRATQLMQRMLPGFAVVDRVEGAAVFVGLDTDGAYGDVPGDLVGLAGRLFGAMGGSLVGAP